ncbi:MAG: hypothetical protein ACOY35_01495 [Bacillota bacterium]
MNQEQQSVISQYDPEIVNRLKKEIINDLKTRREWQENYYDKAAEYNEEYEGDPRGYGYGMGYGSRAGGRMGYGRRFPGYGPGMGMGPGRHYGWCPPPPPINRNRRRPEFDYDWWTDREEYDYQRNMMMLRRQLQNELGAIEKINQRLSQVRDPQVRQLLYELLQEASRQNMDITELMQSINMNNTPGYGVSILDRIIGPFKGVDRRSFGWGAGAALLGLLLLPSLGKSLRPLARRAMEEAMDITERAQSVFAQAKEEFEDIVAEANFNKIKESMATQTGMIDKEPPAK